MDERLHLRFTNYTNITVIAIPAKVYNGLLLNQIWFEIEKILNEKEKQLSKNRSKLKFRRISTAKNLAASLQFIDFPIIFDSIHRENME